MIITSRISPVRHLANPFAHFYTCFGAHRISLLFSPLSGTVSSVNCYQQLDFIPSNSRRGRRNRELVHTCRGLGWKRKCARPWWAEGGKRFRQTRWCCCSGWTSRRTAGCSWTDDHFTSSLKYTHLNSFCWHLCSWERRVVLRKYVLSLPTALSSPS